MSLVSPSDTGGRQNILFRKLNYLRNLLHNQPHRRRLHINNKNTGLVIIFAGSLFEARPYIHNRYNLASQIDQALNVILRFRNPCDCLKLDNLLYILNLQTKIFRARLKGHVFPLLRIKLVYIGTVFFVLSQQSVCLIHRHTVPFFLFCYRFIPQARERPISERCCHPQAVCSLTVP